MDIAAIITQLGFPIACVIGIAAFAVKILEAYRNDLKEQSLAHKAEMDAITQALNNNTNVMHKISDQNDHIMELLKEVKNSNVNSHN